MTLNSVSRVDCFNYLNILGELGFFSEFGATREADAMANAIDNRLRHPQLAENADGRLVFFAHYLVSLWGDRESAEDATAYTDLVESAAHASFGVFSPTHIRDSIENGTRVLRFEHDGKTFETRIASAGDFLDETAFDLINQALSERSVPMRFVEPDAQIGQEYAYFIAPVAAMKRAVRRGLLQVDDENDL